MGDLPEPKQRVNPLGPGGPGSMGANALPQDLASRNDRRLSHMVGLDQVGEVTYCHTGNRKSRADLNEKFECTLWSDCKGTIKK